MSPKIIQRGINDMLLQTALYCQKYLTIEITPSNEFKCIIMESINLILNMNVAWM
jgi:hypothetical protein